jgi:hypothetical protein
MSAALANPPAALPPGDAPVFTQLLLGFCSVLTLAPAALAYEFPGQLDSARVALLWVQTVLLAFGSASLAKVAGERLRPWEGRVAPLAARRRVRDRLLRDLLWMGAIGLAGPAVLGAVLAWQSAALGPLLGVLAVLCAGGVAGLAIGLAWQGRLPRLLLLPAGLVLLLLLLAQPAVVRSLSAGDAHTALPVLAGLAVMGAWLVSPQALRVCAAPWPVPHPKAWLRRFLGSVWRTVPYAGSQGPSAVRELPFTVFIFLPQLQIHAERLHWLAWGQRFDDVYAALGYGLWMLALGIFASAGLIAPRLHWRHRLAPGGLTAQRWGRQLVLGSLLFLLTSLGLGLALGYVSRPFAPSVWASALGDMLLAASAAAWLLGRRGSRKDGLWIVLGLGLGGVAVIAVPLGLGLTPQRGAPWLALQLALTVPMTLAAVRAWGRRDLNQVA